MRKKIGRFKGKADDGQIFIIFEYQNFIDGTIDDPDVTGPGFKDFCTSNGKGVKDNDDGTYEIVSSGLIVHRIS
jgi:hypothetical protein